MRLTGIFLLPAVLAAGADLRSVVEPQLPSLVAVYRGLHAQPELSHYEEHTAAFVAGELRKAGFTVTEHVGKYADGSAAFGVVGVLKNGEGPVVMVRTELDALPVVEKTGLPFASTVRTHNAAGQEVGVMHACGHDLHMTSFIGSARTLASLKDQWHGTLIMVGQPSEETVDGARAMLADGFMTRFPKPDFAIALHDANDTASGTVGVLAGPLLASSTAVDVTMRGLGGHGAHPEATKDPVVMAAEFVVALQTIVSRQISPRQPAVVTVGSIHGGAKRNVIPDEVLLQLSVRAFSEDVRRQILAGIERTARGIAIAGGVPEDRMPIVKVDEAEMVPVTKNDAKLTARLRGVFVATLGAENVVDAEPQMVSEDFGLFGLDGQIPTFMFHLGAVPASRLDESKRTGVPLPSLHSSLFYPEAEPAIRTGVTATTAAVIDLMRR